MELKDIDAKIAELTQMRADALKEEEAKQAQAKYDEAVQLIPQLIENIRKLNEIGYLPKRLVDVLTDESGKVNPGQYLKRPRAIAKPHS